VREAITMWKYTRMVVLVALTAAMYAAALIPFKLLPIIPGITELRPANVFPVICSLMFGPAGAWGAAIGNLIGDLMGGTYGLGSYFGMLGNFLFGYIPYRLWRILTTKEPGTCWSPGMLVRYLYVTLLASIACGVVVGWGLDTLGLVPFHVLALLISMNNFITAGILGPLLLPVLYQRVKQWGLTYQDIMSPEDLSRGHLPHVVHLFLVAALLGSLYFGISISLGMNEEATGTIPLLFGIELPASENLLMPFGESVTVGLIPLISLLVIACILI